MRAPTAGASDGEAPVSQTLTGLTSAEARATLARVGPNALASRQRFTIGRQALRSITNPLTLILLLASGVSASLGETTNAIIIFVIVALSVGIDTFQTARSQRAADALRRSVALTATVLRDGAWQEVERRAIVPGDIIRLAAGDLVPADATLLESHDLYAQEAALTGESLPAEKHAATPQPQQAGADDAITPQQRVFLGSSIISGAAVARVTATGRTTEFGEIAARLRERAPETEFERGLRGFGMLILRTVFFLVLFVFLVSVVARHDPLESLIFAVALAVGLTPEFLPMITTVTLTQGAVHMAWQHVVVKRLEAIQNFGSMDILCSDKTGTLTSGEMTLGDSFDPLGAATERAEQLAAINSRLESGIRSPLDAAILRAAEARPELETLSKGAIKVDELPFDFDRRRLSVVADVGGERLLITKGAPESVLPLCVTYEAGGVTAPLDEATRAAATAVYTAHSAQGERALAVAIRAEPRDQAHFTVTDERDLTLIGFLGFADQPLPDAAEALTALAQDGVRVKILTGDNELVARHVCQQVGLDATQLVRGSDIDHMTDAALSQVAERAAVFARVSPAQKNRIIVALKNRKHVVGFMGDGVNDAPSLHAADVGISVATAVDVAKDTAEIILMRPGLGVLHKGILEGRKSFGNVMKYLLMGTSSNFGNMFSMAAAAAFLPFLPMLPTQILLNNLLYDLAQVTIPTDNVDASYIRKPHRWDIRSIRNFMVLIGPISSLFDFLTFFVLLRFFHASETLFHTGWFVESLATQTLVLFIIRTAGNPFASRPSRPLTVTTLGIVALATLLPFTPLAAALGFTPLPLGLLALIAAMTVVYLILVDLVKRPLMRAQAGDLRRDGQPSAWRKVSNRG